MAAVQEYDAALKEAREITLGEDEEECESVTGMKVATGGGVGAETLDGMVKRPGNQRQGQQLQQQQQKQARDASGGGGGGGGNIGGGDLEWRPL